MQIWKMIILRRYVAVDILPYLDKIYSGEERSKKHDQFFSRNGKESQSLLYTCIYEPFTDEQYQLGKIQYNFF